VGVEQEYAIVSLSPIVLVGREQAGAENLGMRYVAAALEQAGYRVRILSLSSPKAIDAVAREVMRLAPPVLGLAISDVVAVVDLLVLANLLRKRGYRGHITSGGALATLVRDQLLARHPEIDSVVRHAGEVPMVELCRRVLAGRSVHGVPGVTTRDGDGAPALPEAPDRWLRPLRHEPMDEVLGLRVAQIVGSRGCLGSCGYCSSTSLRKDALEEARRSGLPLAQAKQRGIGGRQRRSPEDLADEAAELFSKHGVRVFQLLDDNVVGGDAGASLSWLRELVAALAERGVRDTAWSMMIDPGSVTEPMLDAMDDLGVVRVLIGVEALTNAGLRRLGRAGSSQDVENAIDRLRQRGIAVVFNCIAVHPQATAASIQSELEALAHIQGAHVDVNPMLVYPQSAVQKWLSSHDKGRGGMLGYLYDAADPAATRFAALLVRIAIEAQEWYAAGKSAYDLATLVSIADRLQLAPRVAELKTDVEDLVTRVGRVRLAALRSLLAVASAELSDADRWQAFRALVLDLRRELRTQEASAARLRDRIGDAMRLEPARLGSLGLRSVAGVVLLVAAACGGSVERTSDDDAPSDSGTGAMSATGGGGSTGTGATGGAAAGSGAMGSGATGGASGGSISTGGQAGSAQQLNCDLGTWEPIGTVRRPCADQEMCAELSDARDTLMGCGVNESAFDGWRISIDAEGRVSELSAPDGVPADVLSCARIALERETFPCLADGEAWWISLVLLR
jgi:radical SAM superfamily enzyme YgiQ (UPF0313 family)